MKNYKLKAMLLMTVLLCNVPAFAVLELWKNGVYYRLYDRTAEVCGASTDITAVVIPEKITYKGNDYAVTSIGIDAFYGCKITSVVIPSSVMFIAGGAFMYCSSLTSIVIPNSVVSIANSAFFGCSRLSAYHYKKDGTAALLIMGNKTDEISGKQEYNIPKMVSYDGKDYIVTGIGACAFVGCSSLVSISIPSSVTNIGADAFNGCSSLASISIPNSVTDIGHDAFSGCSSLASINIPNSVVSIGNDAFSSCRNLTSVIIPSFVKSIGNSAFADCSNLKKIVSMAVKPPACGQEAFGGMDLECTLYVPEGSVNAYKSALVWRGFYNIETSIKSTLKSVSATEEKRFTIDGMRIASPQKGINIIRMSDGTAKKMLVK